MPGAAGQTVPADPAPPTGERVARAWEVLRTVPDPEIPVISLVELGIVREVQEVQDAGLQVVLTPTYSGCPATEFIERSVVEALHAAGLGPVQVATRRLPAWTTDWISAEGRRKLRDYGIAPPGPVDAAQGVAVRIVPRTPAIECPRCASRHTERLSAFGSTACKSLHRCLDCREPFEHFKPL